MGLTENQKNMIRCLANKDIKNTREWAKVVLMDDSTQKNKSFVDRYLPILTNPTGYASEDIPLDLRGILQYEDVSINSQFLIVAATTLECIYIPQ